MTQYNVLLLSKLVEPAQNLLALSNTGEVLVSQTEKATPGGNFPASGVAGYRFQTSTGKRLILRYALSEPPTRPVSVTAMNQHGEVVGGYPGAIGSEGSHGLFWNVQGKMIPLTGGTGIGINDAGQIITDETHVTDGQTFGDFAVALAPGARGKPIGTLRLARTPSDGYIAVPCSINQRGTIVGTGLTLWQPGAYRQGKIIEQDNPDNKNTPFANSNHPLITNEGIIVCLGTSPHPVPPEALRFHRWKPGVSSTAVTLRFPADSRYRIGSKLVPGAYRLTTIGANARGEILLNIDAESVVNGKKKRLQEAILWRKDGSAQRLPQIQYGVLLNDRGWILGATSERETSYALLRPKE